MHYGKLIRKLLKIIFHPNVLTLFFRCNHWRFSVKKGVLQSFVNFTGKHLFWSLFLMNWQTPAQVFSSEICEIYETPIWVTSANDCFYFLRILIISLATAIFMANEHFSKIIFVNFSLLFVVHVITKIQVQLNTKTTHPISYTFS